MNQITFLPRSLSNNFLSKLTTYFLSYFIFSVFLLITNDLGLSIVFFFCKTYQHNNYLPIISNKFSTHFKSSFFQFVKGENLVTKFLKEKSTSLIPATHSKVFHVQEGFRKVIICIRPYFLLFERTLTQLFIYYLTENRKKQPMTFTEPIIFFI